MVTTELMFNDLCTRHEHPGFSKSPEDATRWLIEFSELLIALAKHRNLRQLRVPISFRSINLIRGHSLGRFLNEEEDLIPLDHRNNIKTFVDRGAYLDEIDGISDQDGVFVFEEVSYIFQYKGQIARGLGAAHLLRGLAISICTEEDWDCASLEIERHHNSGAQMVNIPHASKHIHLSIPRRVFERNPKHDIPNDIVVGGELVSKLDLSDTRAQELLDRAIQPDKDTRLYGYCEEKKRFYVFAAHSPGSYHAFPIELKDIRNRRQVLRRLVETGLLSDGDAQKYTKGS